MPRPSTEHYELTETEKRDLIKLIEEGKPLPERYRFLLFEDKREVVCDLGKLYKVSKDKQGVVTREALTKDWTDWVDYWAVDFDYESRKEIIQQPKNMGMEGELPGVVQADQGEFIDFEERWTGAYIFENEWQSFRTRKDRELDLLTAPHTGAIKVVDIFGNDTMALVPVNVG